MSDFQDRSVAIVGAGLFGLVTAKVLLNDFKGSFDSVTIFEKKPCLGGVWSTNSIYPGLTSNSPALTYEIPGYELPKNLRRYGSHVKAEDLNTYLCSFAKKYDLEQHVSFNSFVEDVAWNKAKKIWTIKGNHNGLRQFEKSYKYLIVCNGMYQERNMPNFAENSVGSSPTIYHSADIGDPSIRSALSTSKHTLIVGAGKSAIDLATMIASTTWDSKDQCPPNVTLVYQKPHWLSPRAILRGTLYFERILFSRFLNAWLPFANNPDSLHRWIAESHIGQLLTKIIFRLVSDDFKKSCNQLDLPDTIPDYPMKTALSGALHVAPTKYIDLVRSNKIRIIKGTVESVCEDSVIIKTHAAQTMHLDVDKILCATGYKLSFPFFSNGLLQQLGLVSSENSVKQRTIRTLKLHRLMVPPKTMYSDSLEGPYRNIAFNGFAYSLLNPTVSYISAHWIAEYFLGLVPIPSPDKTQRDIDHFYSWQKNTFGAHGAQGVHIGSHATLYTDLLLEDMQVQTGHVSGARIDPVSLAKEWFRPMYPQIYAGLSQDRAKRDREAACKEAGKGDRQPKPAPIAKLLWLVVAGLCLPLIFLARRS